MPTKRTLTKGALTAKTAEYPIVAHRRIIENAFILKGRAFLSR